ncbi:MAG: vitamin B12 dependent methionine synthase [Anaerolineae bacterium]|nr:vitamin B12 dependent methionine synthase [Anaerolineae bacterium]
MNTNPNAETTFILDEIDFRPNIASLKKRLHIKDGSSLEADLVRLLDEARAIARPKAMHKLVFIDEKQTDAVVVDGITLRSRVLRVNLDAVHRAFAYVATCGQELQAWGETQDDMVFQFWADVIKEAALGSATRALHTHLETCYELGKTATMAPGSLADWPIREQRPLFKILGDPEAAIGIQLTDSFLMIPNKSISGIRFTTEERFESCLLCPRVECPGRRAVYQPALYKEKYQV